MSLCWFLSGLRLEAEWFGLTAPLEQVRSCFRVGRVGVGAGSASLLQVHTADADIVLLKYADNV